MWGFLLYKTGKNNKVLSLKLYKLDKIAGQLVNVVKLCEMYEIYSVSRTPPLYILPTP